ncbi:uncharacterized protein [Apostichopus japonicus]|uniref:uncharacterized protein isoform X2 n=1 Tax=Stichopus japonicus TaxID=307972 RepID=UPI003AB16526
MINLTKNFAKWRYTCGDTARFLLLYVPLFHDFYHAIPVILKTPCNMDLYVFAIVFCALILTPSLGFSVKVDFSTNINKPIRYTAEELRTMKPRPCHLANDILNLDLPYEMRRRKRGKAGGVRKRLKTQTWLNETVTDDCVNKNGFKLVRGDRDLNLADKQKGGGVCLYVNEQWCHTNNVTTKQYLCSTNVEDLVAGLRPYYLPRECSHVIHLATYVPNRSVARAAANELSALIQDLETAHPNAFVVIYGDFNHCSLRKTSVNYYQHVHCPTHGEATLELCYSNVKEAYVASPITKLGKSDHDLIIMQSKYPPIVQRQKPKLLTVKQWNRTATDHPQLSLDLTDWNVFVEATDGIDELTQTIKQIKVYPNNKPWITREVKLIINKKKQLYGQGDKDGLKAVQKRTQ